MRDLTDKLTARGAEALEDGELLALLLGDGVAGEPMEQLADAFPIWAARTSPACAWRRESA